jgi:hypothetical protein
VRIYFACTEEKTDLQVKGNLISVGFLVVHVIFQELNFADSLIFQKLHFADICADNLSVSTKFVGSSAILPTVWRKGYADVCLLPSNPFDFNVV